jgi:hypothetical protein
MQQWSLRDEAYRSFHNWPTILLFFLCGSLLGWLISYLWPSPHQAEVELYVGFNAYRNTSDPIFIALANPEFTNPDDYKNWQLASLNSLVLMGDVVKQTLNDLRAQDGYWNNISEKELASLLEAKWRNAGQWRLVASSQDEQRALQLVTAWEGVILERVYQVQEQARQTMILDYQLKSLVQAQAQVISQTAAISPTLAALNDWQAQALARPPLQSVDQAERQKLLAAVEMLKQSKQWEALLDEMPAAEATTAEHTAWVEQTILSLKWKLSSLYTQLVSLENARLGAMDRYAAASRLSLGFSPNLEVVKTSESSPKTIAVRSPGLAAVIGGMLGLLAWLLVWAARVTRQVRQ